jgi:cobalt-precorrin-5B (C1)-methyltransferase
VWATVVKEAGGDPDVTDKAEITALVGQAEKPGREPLLIRGGKGVGRVTKPGLVLPPGEDAINPVPRMMIRKALAEVTAGINEPGPLEITIAVPRGEILARKTLNERLGILGGLSILGTTGYVEPVSAEAWKETIKAGLAVARAAGLAEVVLSAGRASERAHEKAFRLPKEAYILMGDHVAFSLDQAGRQGFKKIHLAAQWGKLLKIAGGSGDTHVRAGFITPGKAVAGLAELGILVPGNPHTAREILSLLAKDKEAAAGRELAVVCQAARRLALPLARQTPVTVFLVSYEGRIIAQSD